MTISASCVLTIFALLWFRASHAVGLSANTNSESTDVANEPDNRVLLFSTLDGSLFAIHKHTGDILWKVHDKPVVQVPLDTSEAIVPLFLPDPRDGSLYLLGASEEPLKKLPFTIPQLVASSPCRSSDGILYTGKKKDSWFILDPHTGQRQHILGWDSTSPTCPIQSPEAVYLGRTQYSIMMIDTQKGNRRWNITFYEYSSMPMGKDMLNNYEFVHFASSSTGRVVTMDRRTGSFLWEKDLGSPLISAYILDPEGLIVAPFTIMANHTLSHLANHLITHQQPFQTQPSHMKLYPTLYIGEHASGLYAIPSFVDQNLVSVSASGTGPLLLGGPDAPNSARPYPEYPMPGENYRIPAGVYNQDPLTFQSIPGYNNYTIIFIGHYNVPNFSNTKLLIAGHHNAQFKLITYENDDKRQIVSNSDNIEPAKSIGVQTEDVQSIIQNKIVEEHASVLNISYSSMKAWINQQENKGLKLMLIILFGCMIAMFWYLKMQVREFQQLSQSGSKSSQSSSFSRNGVTAVAEELVDGFLRVGKITFHPEKLLGKGCEGTFVYRGTFDNRDVAVKRLLPECFTFADREVALLRESDAHPNVVRYYCTEQDRMFRYIALELCQATLHDYVQGKCDKSKITPLDILWQATSGLAHLHSLDIVHRDIKPHNVLLSVSNANGEVRAMISDFGLCKKLQVGRVSFSRRSGITGTDGWIAPEMLKGNERTTCAVDFFSLGCLYYYVLSEGRHPFGDTLRRQANILSGESDLGDLKGVPWAVAIQKPLLCALLSSDPSERPHCKDILAHPMFWSKSNILAFLQDVSDRVEKADLSDPVLNVLEAGGISVVQGDWRMHIHEEVAKDLRKYRSYKGESVRDLLRALRNKKHHYRELTPDAQEVLGDIPNKFTSYWLKRFPLLLVHSWLSMQCVATEPNFAHYYNTSHRYALMNFRSNDASNVLSSGAYSSPAIEIFDKKNDKRKESLYNKSPRKPTYKSKSGLYFDIKPDGKSGHFKQENVGLYRNFNVDSDKPQNFRAQGDVLDVNSINIKLVNYDSKEARSNLRPKKVKQPEKPLVWALAPDRKKDD